MALFKNIEEVRKFVPVGRQLDIDNLLPFINNAERDFIKKYLGFGQYQALHQAYNDNSLTPDQEELLELARGPLANIAVSLYLNIGRLTIDDGGVAMIEKSANGFAIADLKRELQNNGLNELEFLLEFLEANKDTYPLWKESNAYTVFKQYFINTASTFSDIVDIGASRSTFLALVPIMRKVEALGIEKALGRAFMLELKAEIASGVLSENTKELLPYIQNAVAYNTALEALQTNSYEIVDGSIRLSLFMSDGVGSKQLAANASTVLETKINKAKEDTLSFNTELKRFLNSSASPTKYANYFNSTAYTPPAGSPSINKAGSATVWM